eukprot:TRINITY_DN4441_c0_g9_i1.p1 TRINITY_DN4441_c0_g9~~TRINITY_DN4441_c0_g9_i1.p1  ORF type:complete len:587 (-),score=170.14 TRINITY_DN4441_c0_g9_i1:103-1782(-)
MAAAAAQVAAAQTAWMPMVHPGMMASLGGNVAPAFSLAANAMAAAQQKAAEQQQQMQQASGASSSAGSSSSSAGGTAQAVAAYAAQELKKFVATHNLSKKTKDELEKLSPEDMLKITESDRKGADQEQSKYFPNADGGEDIVILARIARLKAEAGITTNTATEKVVEAKSHTYRMVADEEEEKAKESKTKKEKDQASPKKPKEELQLPKEVETEFKEKIASRKHSVDLAQAVVKFVQEHNLPMLAEKALLMLSTHNARGVMKMNVSRGGSAMDDLMYFLNQKDKKVHASIRAAEEKMRRLKRGSDGGSRRRRSRRSPERKRQRSRRRSRSTSKRKRKVRRRSRRRSESSKSDSDSSSSAADKKSRKASRSRSRNRNRKSKSPSRNLMPLPAGSSAVDAVESEPVEEAQPTPTEEVFDPEEVPEGLKQAFQELEADLEAIPAEVSQSEAATQELSENAEVAQVDAEAEIYPEGPREEELFEWLNGLDSGRGSMLKYFVPLRDEFDCDFTQIASVRLAEPIAPGALGSIEPSFFEALGIRQVGHRLLLAKGILKLPDPEQL